MIVSVTPFDRFRFACESVLVVLLFPVVVYLTDVTPFPIYPMVSVFIVTRLHNTLGIVGRV